MVTTKRVALSKTLQLPVADVPHAPFIFFDEVPTSGALEGVVTITHSAKAMLPSEDGQTVRAQNVAVAYLRCNRKAAFALKEAIENALLVGVEPKGSSN